MHLQRCKVGSVNHRDTVQRHACTKDQHHLKQVKKLLWQAAFLHQKNNTTVFQNKNPVLASAFSEDTVHVIYIEVLVDQYTISIVVTVCNFNLLSINRRQHWNNCGMVFNLLKGMEWSHMHLKQVSGQAVCFETSQRHFEHFKQLVQEMEQIKVSLA